MNLPTLSLDCVFRQRSKLQQLIVYVAAALRLFKLCLVHVSSLKVTGLISFNSWSLSMSECP